MNLQIISNPPPPFTPHTEPDQIRWLPSIKAGGEAFGSQRRPFSFKARSCTMLSPSTCLVVVLLSSLEVETAISATSTWSKSNLRNPNWPSVTLTTCTARTSLDVQQPHSPLSTRPCCKQSTFKELNKGACQPVKQFPKSVFNTKSIIIPHMVGQGGPLWRRNGSARLFF